MGRIEAQSARLTKKNRTKYLILESIKIAGVLSIALVAPNVLTGLAKLGVIATPRAGEVAKRSYTRMIAAGLLKFDGKFLRLTEKGKLELDRMTMATKKPTRWDGKWRVLIFDIPDYRRSLRDKVRSTLRMLGFERLQDSVWIYPYDCEDHITLLKADFKVGKDMLYMVVDSLEGDDGLRKKFSLKS